MIHIIHNIDINQSKRLHSKEYRTSKQDVISSNRCSLDVRGLSGVCRVMSGTVYSTVTDLARFLGQST